MLPTQTVTEYTLARIEEATKKIVKELHITGPFNIQFIAKGSDTMVIECNLRASRCVILFYFWLFYIICEVFCDPYGVILFSHSWFEETLDDNKL
jgi:carbamoylphosphate synthase large subunit